MFLQHWKTTDARLGSKAKRKGDPTLTWTMFPQGVSHLNPARRYLKISQRLQIIISAWPDYDARITYHFHLFLDNAGRLRGNVSRWHYWVEGGIKSGAIADQLEPSVIAGMKKLNEKLDEQLGNIAFTFSDVYLLPGRQIPSGSSFAVMSPATGVTTGSTLGDGAIVLQV